MGEGNSILGAHLHKKTYLPCNNIRSKRILFIFYLLGRRNFKPDFLFTWTLYFLFNCFGINNLLGFELLLTRKSLLDFIINQVGLIHRNLLELFIIF